LDVGERIKRSRKKLGLSMRELAEGVGVSESYISQLEKGVVNPSLGTLKKLADKLCVTMVDFFAVDSDEEDIVLRKGGRREIIYPSGKIRAQLMVSRLSDKNMEPLYTIIEPGGDTLDPYVHHRFLFSIQPTS
jgi:transcriptional regulator with XRE-family HTH domain